MIREPTVLRACDAGWATKALSAPDTTAWRPARVKSRRSGKCRRHVNTDPGVAMFQGLRGSPAAQQLSSAAAAAAKAPLAPPVRSKTESLKRWLAAQPGTATGTDQRLQVGALPLLIRLW